MTNDPSAFYNELADYYHLIFDDWDRSIARQATVLNGLLASQLGNAPLNILDCACGIGTQAIGLAQLGHHVVASDLSPAAVRRAENEAAQRGLPIQFFVSDMTMLREGEQSGFDAVIALDNALPHLDPSQLRQAATTFASKLRPNGLFIGGIRDYDALIVERPASLPPAFCGEPGSRRIVHQIWDWNDTASPDPGYRLHLYITLESPQGWKALHFVSSYRCLLREELSAALAAAGFTEIRWFTPAQTGSYQPLVLARLS
jgi:SAM-dependent methyltransferase